jgi:predicted N-acetyltransferase YhbS
VNFEVFSERDEQTLDALISGVRSYNFEKAGPETSKPLSVICRDECGSLIGGIAGKTIYRQFLIDVLWVDKGWRRTGLGRKLMEMAEIEARARGCLAAQVDTLSFQAPGFYEKLGFETIGKVSGIPESPERHFLLKRYEEPNEV